MQRATQDVRVALQHTLRRRLPFFMRVGVCTAHLARNLSRTYILIRVQMRVSHSAHTFFPCTLMCALTCVLYHKWATISATVHRMNKLSGSRMMLFAVKTSEKKVSECALAIERCVDELGDTLHARMHARRAAHDQCDYNTFHLVPHYTLTRLTQTHPYPNSSANPKLL